MADRHEEPVGLDVLHSARLDVAQACARDDGRRRLLAQHLVDDMVPDHSHLGILEQAILQDLLGAEAVAAMDQSHLRRVVRQVERFLDRSVAAADHDDVLAAEEEAVTGRAGRHAAAAERLLAGDAQPARRRAGGDDERIGLVAITRIAQADERPLAHVDLDDRVEEQLRADMLGLLLHLLHEPGALDHVREAGIVLDVGGDGQLPAGLDSLHQHRLQAGPRRVDRRRVSRGPRAQDHHLASMSCCHDHSASRQLHIDDIYANLAWVARPDVNFMRNCSQPVGEISQLYCVRGMVLA
jgi:hypothetical protein